MISFIIRRLIAAVFLLIIVSMVASEFSSSCRNSAGQTTYGLATQYVGRNPSRAAVLQMSDQLGLNKPLYLQYWAYLKAIVAGGHYGTGTNSVLPAAVLRLFVQEPAAGLAAMVSDIPVTLSLAIGAAMHLADRRASASGWSRR